MTPGTASIEALMMEIMNFIMVVVGIWLGNTSP